MTPEPLRMLTHVAALWTGLWRRDQAREETLLSSYGSLSSTSRSSRVNAGVSHGRHSHSLIELGGGHTPRSTKAKVGGGRRARRVSEGRRSLPDSAVSRVLSSKGQMSSAVQSLQLLVQVRDRVLVYCREIIRVLAAQVIIRVDALEGPLVSHAT